MAPFLLSHLSVTQIHTKNPTIVFDFYEKKDGLYTNLVVIGGGGGGLLPGKLRSMLLGVEKEKKQQ